MEIDLCGFKVLIDDEDYELIKNITWRVNKKMLRQDKLAYFQHVYKDDNKKQHVITLHRRILGLKLHDGIICDHINGNTLDNTKKNLRKCTSNENNKNRKISKLNTTGYKGVSKVGEKYKAQISVDNKDIYLGLFDNPQDAYKAYCEASIKYHGEFGSAE